MPFESIYIQAINPLISLDIKRRVQASSNTIVVDSLENAQAILIIKHAKLKRRILSVSGTGRVREFQLRFKISFQVTDQKGRELVPDTDIEVTRVLPFSDSAFLSSQAEEKMLLKDMKKDAILKLMDRLGKVK